MSSQGKVSSQGNKVSLPNYGRANLGVLKKASPLVRWSIARQ